MKNFFPSRKDESRACIWKAKEAGYPEKAPFHPDTRYPELPQVPAGQERNPVFEGVRELFRLSGLDRERFGTAEWNPLAGYIREGDTVLLKPNLVKESHPRDPEGWKYVLTHGSVIRAAAEYAFKALEGTGRVIVGDAPQTDSSFSRIVERLGLDRLAEYYGERGLRFELIDLRKEEWRSKDDVIVERTKLSGDPEGYTAFDLGRKSEFFAHEGRGRYYGADYDSMEVNEHHDGRKNEYLLSRTAIQCDVLFNLPKLKTHKKAGVTLNLKNLVGVNGDKNWLPHHTEGAPETGGDQFPACNLNRSLEGTATRILKKAAAACPAVGTPLLRLARPLGKAAFGDTEDVIRSGNWYGNDTLWRMCIDLNKLVFYGNADGTLGESRKRCLCLVDGIVAGQGSGPMNPDPYPAGVLLFGFDPVTVDAAAARVMGFDVRRIPSIRHAFEVDSHPLTEVRLNEVRCVSNVPDWRGPLEEMKSPLRFEPHFGWKDHIELDGGEGS